VTLVNTDGLTLIGAGSEWFWSAVSGIVLAITFIAIYRQLRIAASQSAIAQIEAFTREWNGLRLLLHRRTVLVALRDGTSQAELPDGAGSTLGNYWEGVAGLTRAGHLDRRLIWQQYSTSCQTWWAILAPYARAVRERDHDQTVYEDFEWLVGVLDDMDRRAGTIATRDLKASYDRWIAATDGMLAVERSLQQVYIAPREEVDVPVSGRCSRRPRRQ